MPMAMTRVSFFIDAELPAGLCAPKTRDGVPEAESIRRAIAAYLLDRGVSKRTAKGAKRKSR